MGGWEDERMRGWEEGRRGGEEEGRTRYRETTALRTYLERGKRDEDFIEKTTRSEK